MAARHSYRLEAVKAQPFFEVVRRLGHPPLQAGRHNRCRMRGHPGETAPSMMVYGNERGFYCFGCKLGGSGLDYVMGAEGLTLWEAVEKIEQMFGLQQPRGEGGRTRSRLGEATVERIRTKFDRTPADLSVRADAVEAKIRDLLGGATPRDLPPDRWASACAAYLALDRAVDSSAGYAELDAILDRFEDALSMVGTPIPSGVEGENEENPDAEP